MIEQIPFSAFAIAIFVILALIVIIKGFTMPKKYFDNQNEREELKKDRIKETDRKSEEEEDEGQY